MLYMKKIVLFFLFCLISFVCYANESYNRLPYSVKIGNIFVSTEAKAFISNYGKIYFRFNNGKIDDDSDVEVHYKKIDKKRDSVIFFKSSLFQSVTITQLKAMSDNCICVVVDGHNCGSGKAFKSFCKNVYDLYNPIYQETERNKQNALNEIHNVAIALYQSKDSSKIFDRLIKECKDSLIADYKIETERLADSLRGVIEDKNKKMIEEYEIKLSEYDKKVNSNVNTKRVNSIIGDFEYELGFSNSCGGHSFECSFTNNSKKTIKYYYINLTFRNAVGDLCRDDIRGYSSTTFRGIGPIESECSEYGKCDVIIYDSWAETAIVNWIKFTYTDGTSVTLNGNDSKYLCNKPKKEYKLLSTNDFWGMMNSLGRCETDFGIGIEVERHDALKKLKDAKFDNNSRYNEFTQRLRELIKDYSNKYGFDDALLKQLKEYVY